MRHQGRGAGPLRRRASLARPRGPYRTVAKIEFLRLLAPVIDPVLVDRIGYGLGDAVELVLRRISHVVGTLASAWPNGPQATLGDEPRITEAEIEAARRLRG